MIEMVTYFLGSVTSAHARKRLLYESYSTTFTKYLSAHFWIWSKRICVNLRLNSIELWLLTYFESRIATTLLTPLHSKCIFVCVCVCMCVLMCTIRYMRISWVKFPFSIDRMLLFVFLLFSQQMAIKIHRNYTLKCAMACKFYREKKNVAWRERSCNHIHTYAHIHTLLSFCLVPFRFVMCRCIHRRFWSTHYAHITVVCGLWYSA